MKFIIGFIGFNLVCFKEVWRVNCDERFNDFQIFETHRAPATFQRLQSPPSSKHTLTLNIGLRNQEVDDSIDDLLNRMSDPDRSDYRPHFTDEESESHSKPLIETVEAVVEWLGSHGFHKGDFALSKNQDWIMVKAVPIRKAEEMLQTKYSIYKHHEGDHIIRTESFSLPRHLHKHIELVQPTTMFGRLSAQKSSVRVIEELPTKLMKDLVDPNIPNTCSNPSYVTNDCLRKLYKTEGYKVKSSGKNAIGITGYLGEAANFADAQKFLSAERTDQKNHTFSVVYVNGGKNPQELDDNQVAHQIGVEANLDTQTALGITSPTKNIFYTTGGQPPFKPDITSPYNTNEPFLEWLTYILAQPVSDVPKVISTSYGDDEQTVPISYAKKVCKGFAQLGMRGISVIFSSGDYGVGQDGFCWANDGSNRTTFLPIFPASCPYVTSVGATENFSPEVAVSQKGPGGFYSGGGFSNYFKQPEWQRNDVFDYLGFLGEETYSGMFDGSGRGFPDVAAQGAKYAIAWRGEFLTVGGTSASAPTFASIISLLNDYSISLGGSSLGFLNPWLYKIGRNGINDVTSGKAAGCDTDGFPATYGWDPVTGLGTPDFKRLQSLVRKWSLSTVRKSRSHRHRSRINNSSKHRNHEP
ncbi:peptidase S8/S53 domain-containing protein [Phakopsora pachyrhizi]|uniref:tripeptidyl-peptidase II n=1 Tax=Phakopsora pachyrhizi TaxID=170000 RepID=A0A0S1MKC2_PHAPC|nr:peptidase S8/S53 domain-containing protein [Phakopsora pachyrhizi]CAH7666887.1 peptidase S8/S53 domain-containing protein [Phakopsora pachyrhizi]